MVEQVGLDNVGAHYDARHANMEDPDPRTALLNIRECVNHIHLSESHREHWAPGRWVGIATFPHGRKLITLVGWLLRHLVMLIPT